MIYNTDFLKSLHAEKLAEARQARQARLVMLARKRSRGNGAR
jgi:hypothetical protein